MRESKKGLRRRQRRCGSSLSKTYHSDAEKSKQFFSNAAVRENFHKSASAQTEESGGRGDENDVSPANLTDHIFMHPELDTILFAHFDSQFWRT
jgi:hypothetical protein